MLTWPMTIPPHAAAARASAPALAARDPRVAPLAAALATRLTAVCRGWDGAEFDALVEQIARTKLRWLDRGYGE